MFIKNELNDFVQTQVNIVEMKNEYDVNERNITKI